MKINKLTSMLLLCILAFGLFSFKSVMEGRTKDYCMIQVTSPILGKSTISLIKGNSIAAEKTEVKQKEVEGTTMDMFNSLNADGWELKSTESNYITVQNAQMSSYLYSNYIFERSHR